MVVGVGDDVNVGVILGVGVTVGVVVVVGVGVGVNGYAPSSTNDMLGLKASAI